MPNTQSHTADADATKLFCRVGVGGVNTILITFFNDDVIMSSLLKKLSISIKIQVVK